MDRTLLVLSNSLPGREADYSQWYRTRHLPDMCRVPGVTGGQFFSHLLGGKDPWAIAVRYTIDAPAATVLPAAMARAGTDEMQLTDAIDGSSILMLEATPLTPRIEAADGERADAPCFYIVLTNATDGDDEEFNRWYSDVHLADVLAVPGFVAAQRFAVAPETAGKPSPWRYLAIYEMSAADPAATMAELASRANTDAMPLSQTLRSDVYAVVYAPDRVA